MWTLSTDSPRAMKSLRRRSSLATHVCVRLRGARKTETVPRLAEVYQNQADRIGQRLHRKQNQQLADIDFRRLLHREAAQEVQPTFGYENTLLHYSCHA